jgi:hypothetical protein
MVIDPKYQSSGWLFVYFVLIYEDPWENKNAESFIYESYLD